MLERLKNYTIQFTKEIIPVIAGILIALFIDNWNNDRKDKNYIDQVFSTINSELEETQQEIKRDIPQQKSLVDSLAHYANNPKVTVLDVAMKCGGIQIPNIKMNAWKSVSNAKIDLIGYNKITSLSNIEELKGVLKDKTDFLMQLLYSNMYTTEKDKKQTFKIVVLDIMSTEQTIQKHIQKFKKE
ncbi:hypothetical protein [Flavobacterium sp.]|uniref:hypothetical protein n=1 Tax=Flavobacterium sp. TaxID=239 RepID=UPI003D0B9467